MLDVPYFARIQCVGGEANGRLTKDIGPRFQALARKPYSFETDATTIPVHDYTLRKLATLHGHLRPFYVLDGLSDSEAARRAAQL